MQIILVFVLAAAVAAAFLFARSRRRRGGEVLDRDGASLSLVTREAQRMMSSSNAPLTDGNSHVLSVSEDAARIVLYKRGEAVSSQPLRLVPGEIVTVRRER